MGAVTGKLKSIELPRLTKVVGMHHDGSGLYLRIAKPKTGEPPKAASWVLRYMIDRKARTMGLGPYPEIGLSEARELALAARRLKVRGEDPIQARQAERTAKRVQEGKSRTFKQCAADYIRSHQVGWKNVKHAQQWENTLAAYAYGLIGAEPIASVDNAMVLSVLQQEVPHKSGIARLWEARPETASRLRGRLEAILGWASAGGLRNGDNPARWKGQLEHQLPARGKIAKVEHHAALAYRDIASFMGRLRAQEGVSAKALELAILTASRTGEVLGARWSEFDLERALWIIPEDRMKAGREHRVPLSGASLLLLKGLQGKATSSLSLVFPGTRPGKPLSNMAFLMLLRRMNCGGVTAHGFRSTFKDWASEATEFSTELSEMALAHIVSGKVEAAYRRGDLFAKRLALMAAWADACSTPSDK